MVPRFTEHAQGLARQAYLCARAMTIIVSEPVPDAPGASILMPFGAKVAGANTLICFEADP